MNEMLHLSSETSYNKGMSFRPFVYGLVDPLEPKHVRYVGMTTVSARRPRQHADNARNGSMVNPHLSNWIRKIQAEGREPVVLILEELSEDTSKKFTGFVEACYIKSLREIGHNLTNIADGGEHGSSSPLVQKKKSDSMKRYRKEHPEFGIALNAASKAHPWSEESRKRSSVSLKAAHAKRVADGTFVPPALGYRATPETKARLREIQKTRWTPERREQARQRTLLRKRNSKGKLA